MDLIELSRLLENLLRIGTIHSVDHAARRCRVQSGRLVTQWLRWFEGRAGETTTWNPPTVGEQCIILSPSGVVENGLVIYGAPSDVIDTPSHDPVKHVIKFPDGATFTYDHAASHLEIAGIKTAEIIASESVTNRTPLTHMTGRCIVDDLLTYNNGLVGKAGANGSKVTGGFTNTGGTVSSNGKVLDTHVHSEVYRGSENTGGPV